jgi:hypothetical protein
LLVDVRDADAEDILDGQAAGVGRADANRVGRPGLEVEAGGGPQDADETARDAAGIDAE